MRSKSTYLDSNIKTKVKNAYRTYRETRELFQDESQSVKQLAGRIYKLLSCFKQRAGALEALEARGVYVREVGEKELFIMGFFVHFDCFLEIQARRPERILEVNGFN